MNFVNKILNLKILQNGKFMKSFGFAFILSLSIGLVDSISIDMLKGKLPIHSEMTIFFKTFNYCFYPSIIVLTAENYFNNYSKLTKSLSILSAILFFLLLICITFSKLYDATNFKLIGTKETFLFFSNMIFFIFGVILLIIIYNLIYKER